MRAIGGAILVLAGAVFSGASSIAVAILYASGKDAGATAWGAFPGTVFVLIGVTVFFNPARESGTASTINPR